ncbi:MAG: class I SAM-dependent methyltransferase [Chloroflexi bacterium]|nr:class I SAM-dependent methyltransferase [Chloroflexota bacterium]
MNWHARYLQQAAWTRELRSYLFTQAGMQEAGRALEVGCGTGAILSGLDTPASLHGLDLDREALNHCRDYVPRVQLIRGDGHSLPYPNRCFDIVFCHFLLLWVKDPITVVSEMARVGRSVIALAEPDYLQRIDEPASLQTLGQLQIESLQKQGADPSRGARLADIFHRAGLKIIETGPIRPAAKALPLEEWEGEWEVIESDLKGFISSDQLKEYRRMDREARQAGTRILHIPTYFAWGVSVSQSIDVEKAV